MTKKIKILWLLVVAALLFSGCGMRTVDELYCLPKRSEAYDNLQVVIDEAMQGLEYATPVYGENRQVVQPVDLDGDEVDEYLLFARDSSEKPLKILIFAQLASGYVLMDTIEGYGFAFDFVEYVQLDGKPGLEIVVGRQLSNQMVRSVSVYRYSSGFSRQLFTTGYVRMLTTDLNKDGIKELFLLNHGETEDSNGNAVLYTYENGNFRRSVQLNLSAPASSFRRITLSSLRGGGIPAVYVTTAADANNLYTDVFAFLDGEFTTVLQQIATPSVHNYFVFPEDMNGDGVLDLPQPVVVPSPDGQGQESYLLKWSSIDRFGSQHSVAHTYHDAEQNWYIRIKDEWVKSLGVTKTENATTFYVMGENSWKKIFTITTLTDADREAQANLPGRIILRMTDSVIYVAELSPAAMQLEITKGYLQTNFTPIRVEIDTEED